MKKVLVFSATWCTNCNAQKQRLEQAGIEFEVVDVDKQMQKAREFGVRSLPTTFVMDGDTTLKQFTGISSIEEIKKLIKD